MKLPNWARPERPEPGKKGFSSLPGESDIAAKLSGGRRRAMSGAGNLPFDVAADRWLVDSKETSAASYGVKLSLTKDLTERALREGRRPMLAVTFWKDGDRGETWAVVRLDDLRELERGDE